LHGHQFTDPPVSELVTDGCSAALVAVTRCLGCKNVLIADGDSAGVLHRASIKFRDEDLIVLAEWVRHTEVAVVPIKALLRFGKQTLRIKIFSRRTAAVESKRNSQLSWLIGRCFCMVGERTLPDIAHLVVTTR